MKFTLLEIVQEVLSSLDSDEVNGIDDSTEAMQVALIVRRCYLDLASRLNLNEHFDFFKLNASGDNTLPIIMYRPDSCDQLLWLKYDKRLAASDSVNYEDVNYQEPATFFDRMFMLNTDDSNVSSTDFAVDGEDFKLLYRTDRQPRYWTSLDDYTLIFDAYYSSLDTTLQSSKTHCYGLLNTSFTLSDNFTPDLDSQQFSLLINEAKTLAWAELKQATHQYASREAKRQLVRTQKNKRALPSQHVYGDYHNVQGYGRK